MLDSRSRHFYALQVENDDKTFYLLYYLNRVLLDLMVLLVLRALL